MLDTAPRTFTAGLLSARKINFERTELKIENMFAHFDSFELLIIISNNWALTRIGRGSKENHEQFNLSPWVSLKPIYLYLRTQRARPGGRII